MKKFYLILLTFMISSCADVEKETSFDDSNIPVEILYNAALKHIELGNFKTSSEKFSNLSREHPYSKWSNKAKLMEAYALFKIRSFDESLEALNHFIMLHPANEYIEYAFYLKSLCYYYQISNIQREQKISHSAKSSFNELIKRFPNSKYSKDAKIKLDLIDDHLAGKQMEIGRFYLKKGNNIAAINRFQEVVKNFQTTSHISEALYRLTAIYVSLGVGDEAKKYAAVLGENYPFSKWYKYSYELLK